MSEQPAEPPSEESGTPKPEASETPKPEASETPKPEASETRETVTEIGVRRRFARRRLSHMPLRNLLPNALTLLALAAGLTSVRFALDDQFEGAVIAILAAGILDGLDGRVARMMNSVSRFGAELDSLSDFVSFGIAPAFVVYLWSLHSAPRLGWLVVLFYAMCMALRLARFNTALEDPDKPAWSTYFFTGVPAPAGAGIVMLPIYLDFQGWDWVRGAPHLVALYMVVVGLLSVSRIPTPSFKRIRIDRQYVLPVLVAMVFGGAMLANFPWTTMSLLVVAYLLILPQTHRIQRRLRGTTHGVA